MKLNMAQTSLLLLILAAAIIGGWFYFNQLAATPPWLWFFVPDCPLYALLGAPILLFGFPKNAALRFVISCGLAIFGSWTVFVLMLHGGVYFAPASLPMSAILLLGHFGMMVEGVLCLPKKSELKFGTLLIAIGWFLLNLNLDYFNGALSTYPWIPKGQLDVVMLFTAFMGVTWPIALFAVAGIVEKEKAVGKIREALLVSG